MDEHNFVLKNGDVLVGPLKIETDKITKDLDLINKDYFDKNQFVHTGDTPPDKVPFGAIFVHEDTLKEFIYIENNGDPIWVETSGCSGSGVDEDLFLLKHGHDVDDAPAPVNYNWNQNVMFGSDLNVKLDGNNISADARVRLDLISNFDAVLQSNQSSVKLIATTGAVDLSAPLGAETVLRTIDDTDQPKQIVNKEYVDQRDEVLHNEIIELEEEIDAIAPSVERGVWKMTLSGGALSSGAITMYDGTFGNGNPIGIFKQAQSVWFSANDTAGVPHGFANVDPGHLLELFVQGESDYGLFEVVQVHDQTIGSPNPYYAIDVNFIQALSNTSKAESDDLVRMKTFQAPTGGNAGDFVKRTGDKMSGELRLQYLQGYKASNDTDSEYRIDLANYSYGATMEWQTNKPRISWNENGGVLWGGVNNSSSGIINWKRDSNTNDNFASYHGIVKEPKHITNKEYVDDKYQELLAKIEELEMAGNAGGLTRNTQYVMSRVNGNASTGSGYTLGYTGLTDKLMYVVGVPHGFEPKGKINLTGTSGNDNNAVIEYYITDALYKGLTGAGYSRWELEVALATNESGFTAYSSITGKTEYKVSFVEGAVSTGYDAVTDLVFEGRGITTSDESSVVETNFYGLNGSGGLTNNNSVYGNFFPYKYIENTKAVTVLSIDGADGEHNNRYGTVEEKTFNGVPGIAVYQNSTSTSSYDQVTKMYKISVRFLG